MIHHTKLFVRRLAYTPWLLVASLVLGWTGMAVAQDVNGLTVLDQTAAEDAGTMDFTVILSVPMDKPVAVDYQASSTSDNTASIGVDYTAIPGTETFAANAQTLTISIPITNDTLYEGEDPETFTLTLSNARTVSDKPAEIEAVTLVDAVATGSITENDDAPGLAVGAGTHDTGKNEGDPVNFVVTLTPAGGTTIAVPVTVKYTTKDNTPTASAKAGTDYTMKDGTLTFAATAVAATQTVSVATMENPNDITDNLTFTLELSSPMNAELTGATDTPPTLSETGTIIDDDSEATLKVGVGNATASENSVMQFPVTMTGTSDNALGVVVTYTVSSPPGSATGGAIGTAGIDYVAVTDATLTIAVGQTSGTIYVPILADSEVEEDETFTVTLTAVAQATLAAAADAPLSTTATGTILSQLPTLSVEGMSVDEAEDAMVDFTVSLSAATTGDVTVKYLTVDGSATGGEEGDDGIDYVSVSSTLTIEAGDTEGTVSVMIVDDDVEEGDESFSLTLSEPTNATIETASAMGTINANDAPPDPPSLSVSEDASAVEGEAVVFTVMLSEETTEDVTFSYEISIEADDTAEPADFTNFMDESGMMTIEAGDTETTVSVMTEDDDADESSESFTLTLSSVTNATPETVSVKGMITDNDLVSVSVSDAKPVVEGADAMFTVTLSAATDEAVTVQYMTEDGTATAGEDYTAVRSTLTFAADETEKMVSVTTLDDAVEESAEPETFTLTLSDPSNAVLGDMKSAQGTITDNESPSLSVSDASAVEGENVEFTVTLSKSSGVDQEFSYGISIEADDTATPDDFVDFVGGSGTVTIAAGATEATVSVATRDDNSVEEDETFTLTVGGETAKGTITDNDLPSLSVSDASAVEGENVEFTVMLSVATDDAVTVKYATSIEADDTAKQADFTATSGTVTIAAGATEATVSVATVDDDAEEAAEPETFTLTLSNPSNAELSATMSSAQGTITDNESPTPSVSDASAVEGENVEFTVTLSKSSTADQELPYRISIEADDTATPDDFVDFVGGSGTVTIAAGATEATVSVATRDDNSVEEDETFTLTVGGETAKGTITDNDVRVPPPTGAITLTVSPSSVREDAGTTTEVSVTASVASPTDAAVAVALALSGTAKEGTDYTVSGTQSITIAAGATLDKTVLTFTPINDASYEGDETILITGSGIGYTSGSTRVTLIDDDEPSTPVSSGGGGTSPPPPPPPPPSPSFDDETIAAQFYIQGTAIDPLVFPTAQDGTKPLTYGLSQTSTAQAAIDPLTGLPDSLAFDPKTRTLTGTPATPLPATEFSYTVIDADGRTASLCFDLTIYALIGPPTPPTDLTVAFDADGKLVLHWKEPARNGGYDLTSYEVQYQKTTSASWRGLAIRVPANHPTKTYTIGGLQADAEYNVRVRAYNLNPLPDLSLGEWAMASTDETAMPDEIAAGTGEPAADGAVCKPGVGGLLATEDAGDGEPSGDGDGDDGEPTVPSAPGAPTNLTATPGDGKLLLRWKEPTQTGGFDLTFYDLQYQKTTSDSWISVAIRIPANYRTKTYSIGSLQNGVAYNVQVRVHNLNPDPELSVSGWTTATATPTENAAAKQAASFELASAYPNPFNPSTTIGYALPQATDVRLDIYNIMGQRVRTLVAAHQPAGYYAVEWKATDDSGHTLSSGVYFYRLQAGAFRATKRLLLMR